MFTELRAVFARCSGTLLQDATGAVALIVLLVVSLHLPSFA